MRPGTNQYYIPKSIWDTKTFTNGSLLYLGDYGCDSKRAALRVGEKRTVGCLWLATKRFQNFPEMTKNTIPL